MLILASGTNRPSKSRFCQPGRERPRWIGRKPGCAEPRGAEPKALPKTIADLMLRSAFLFSSPMRDSPTRTSRIMSTTIQAPSIRIRTENPNHHLWNNHGTWFLHYTVHPTPFTKERIRCSLGTKDLTTARRQRDHFLSGLVERFSAPMTSVGRAVAA